MNAFFKRYAARYHVRQPPSDAKQRRTRACTETKPDCARLAAHTPSDTRTRATYTAHSFKDNTPDFFSSAESNWSFFTRV